MRYPTPPPFVVPYGVKLKRSKESKELKRQREVLRNCINKKKSINGKVVYELEIEEPIL